LFNPQWGAAELNPLAATGTNAQRDRHFATMPGGIVADQIESAFLTVSATSFLVTSDYYCWVHLSLTFFCLLFAFSCSLAIGRLSAGRAAKLLLTSTFEFLDLELLAAMLTGKVVFFASIALLSSSAIGCLSANTGAILRSISAVKLFPARATSVHLCFAPCVMWRWLQFRLVEM
jgi:hypothetical protein